MKKYLCLRCSKKNGKRRCSLYDNKYVCEKCCAELQKASGYCRKCIYANKPESSNTKIGETILSKAGNETYTAGGSVLGEHTLLLGDSEVDKNTAKFYMRAGRYKEAAEILKNIDDASMRAECLYLIAECYYNMKEYDTAALYVNRVFTWDSASRGQKKKARILMESILLSGGCIFELLLLLNSTDDPDFNEKAMLLECSLMFNRRNVNKNIFIASELLKSGYYRDNVREKAKLAAVKIILLFKCGRIDEAYEVFEKYREIIIGNGESIQECREACGLMGFFLHSIDISKSLTAYQAASNACLSTSVMEEIYKAFSSIEVSPYIRAKAVKKAITLITEGTLSKDGGCSQINPALQTADTLYEEEEYYEAAEFYALANVWEYWNPQLILRWAHCLMKYSRFNDAYDILIKMERKSHERVLYPKLIICLIEIGMDWRPYFNSVNTDASSFRDIYELAGCLSRYGQYESAAYLYESLIQKYKECDLYSKKMICLNMAFVYEKLNNHEKARMALDLIPEEYRDKGIKEGAGCSDLTENQFIDGMRCMIENVINKYYGGE